MKKIERLIPLPLLILKGCSNISKEGLIDKICNVTAGYKDGIPKGTPDCRGSYMGEEDGTVGFLMGLISN